MTLSTRLATPDDRPRLLAAIASSASPLQLAHAVDTLLAHPSAHPCFLVEADDGALVGVAPITLVPHLALGGLVAWLPVGVMAFSDDVVTRDTALAAVNEYARAHGILHVLLPPAALAAYDATALGFAPDASGCWRRSARPSPKSLG
ncbi:hypothetical protein K6V72_09230 [Ralstonia insidiosa]|jgi:hypothetical protein|uniref:Uncharacterized protein n=1 Tax=Ralstonia insidiosa TaxID=190721 RepID=A0A192A1B3_9RALS|nr:hypothetical protein [Ralstonia insidiosa]ANJ74087.1 hypothetical protein A9Y76_17245 [Ralstonia insidiosa]KAB0471303.1 hypothetical protein F7R11_01485 [Ralstonia insidiosa]MBY4909172.1 hypothetical protein [Ralstonia insidiosa]